MLTVFLVGENVTDSCSVFRYIGTVEDPKFVLAPDFSKILVMGSKNQIFPSSYE